MRIVEGSVVDKPNEWILEKWCKFHSRYCDKLVLLVDNINREDLTKETYEMLSSYNVDVSNLGFEWHEGKARTLLMQKMQKYNPEWFCVCDSDEIFSETFFDIIDSLLLDKSLVWYAFHHYCLWGDFQHYRIDGCWGYGAQMQVIKIFKNCSSTYSFGTGNYHVTPQPHQVNDKKGKCIENVKLINCGYAKPDAWNIKYQTRGEGYQATVTFNLENVKVKEINELIT